MLDQVHDIVPYQGFAAGQADFTHAQGREGRCHPEQFLQAQHLRTGYEGHIFRHAVNTAKVAAISHRQAHVIDLAPEAVDQK